MPRRALARHRGDGRPIAMHRLYYQGMPPGGDEARPRRSLGRLWWLFGIAFAGGMLLRGFLPPFVVDQPLVRAFITSAGFGGLMAVVAAVIAYAAARHGARSAVKQAEKDREQAERHERKAQWWSRAQWALNQTVSGETEAAKVGHRVLAALGESEWAEEHEFDVIEAATSAALEATPWEGDLPQVSTVDPERDRMEPGGRHADELGT